MMIDARLKIILLSRLFRIYNEYHSIPFGSSSIDEGFLMTLGSIANVSRLTLAGVLDTQGPLTFPKLIEYLKGSDNLKNDVILKHLKFLELAGIVQNFLQKSEESSEYSFYEVTDYGKAIIKSIHKFVRKYFKYFIK